MRRPFFFPVLALALLLASVAAFSCGGSAKPEPVAPTPFSLTTQPVPTPTPTPVDPEAILKKSGEVMNLLGSFQFELTHQGGGTPIFGGIVMQEAKGDVVKPDRLSVTMSGAMGQLFIEVQLITVGDTSYMTNPLTGQWEILPANVSPLGFFSPREGIAAIMSQVTGVTFEGVHTNGEAYFLLRGTILSQALQPLAGTVAQGEMVGVELKIDVERMHLLEAVLTGKVTPTEEEGIVRVIRLSRFNQPVDIMPPQ